MNKANSYTPKPGDKVTSPLLVGEWEVATNFHDRWIDLTQGDERVSVLDSTALTPVTPPIPPEPAIGSVVRAHGRLWMLRQGGGWWAYNGLPTDWDYLAKAPDLSPVVVRDDVANWVLCFSGEDTEAEFRAEFDCGWDQ